jgi:hypothetical protein
MSVWEVFAEIAACHNVIPDERMRLYDEVFNRSLGITVTRDPGNWAPQGRLQYVPEKNWYVVFERRADGAWMWIEGDPWE